jgi:hypothetical protein
VPFPDEEKRAIEAKYRTPPPGLTSECLKASPPPAARRPPPAARRPGRWRASARARALAALPRLCALIRGARAQLAFDSPRIGLAPPRTPYRSPY